MVAVFAPVLVGVNLTVKVVVPPPEVTGDVGCAWILNWSALVPPMAIGVVNVKFSLPELVMVNTTLVLLFSDLPPKL